MDAALSVEEASPAAGMPTATVTVSIPNGHTLANGLHLHGIRFKSHMDRGRPFVSAPLPSHLNVGPPWLH